MEFTEIVVPAALISAAIWLSRNWIASRLSSDIQLDNDTKLEKIKSEIQQTNDRLANITSAGGQAFSTVHAELLPHKIKAIEALWRSVLKWNEMSVASSFVCMLSLDWIRKNASDPNTVKQFENLLDPPNDTKFLEQRNSVESYRPFVSDRIWALYSAYNSFYGSRIVRAGLFLIPTLDHAEIFENIDERALIEKSAPTSILEVYDANKFDGTNMYLNYLKEELVIEFQAELSGERDSSRAAKNTAEILSAANELINSVSTKPLTENG